MRQDTKKNHVESTGLKKREKLGGKRGTECKGLFILEEWSRRKNVLLGRERGDEQKGTRGG